LKALDEHKQINLDMEATVMKTAGAAMDALTRASAAAAPAAGAASITVDPFASV
jgi:hypothetical protein